MNIPTTSTEQMLAAASSGVSSTLAAEGSVCVFKGSLGARAFFFDILLLFKEPFDSRVESIKKIQ
jgi:hypothetical protein